jgi:AraC-like DNA-binding protein
MLLRDFLPHPALREFIQWYRICHFEFGNTDNIPVKAAAPKPENILHFFLRDFWAFQRPGEKKFVQPAIVLIGQRTSLVQQFTGSNFLNVQIVFQPTAVFRLTGIPANELENQHLDATLIFRNDIRTTLEQLQHASGYNEMLAIIENFSFALVRQSREEKRPLDVVTQQMIRQGGTGSLDGLADEACLCTKQFKRKFYERVGVNPKTYARIIRLTRAYNLKNAYPTSDWLSIALASGCYDYRHLVRDYKDFTGLTPSEFHAMEGRTPESLLGLTAPLYQDRANPIS